MSPVSAIPSTLNLTLAIVFFACQFARRGVLWRIMSATLRSFLLAVLGVTLLVVAGCQTPPRHGSDKDALSEPYLRSAGDLVVLAGTVVHLRADGSRDHPALILIHGFGSSLHSWDAWAEDLMDRYRVLRFDLPGSGLSPPDQTGLYTDARAFELIEAVMARDGAERVTLIGHSLGGRIAWSYAARFPDRVDQLILISPDGYESPFFRYNQPARIPIIARLAPYFLPRPVVYLALRRAYGSQASPDAATLSRYYDLIMQPGARQALLERMRQTILTNPDRVLPGLQVPTLLVWGEEDRIIPIDNADDYLRALPQARLIRFNHIGHLPQEEAPALTLRPIKAFLQP